MRNDGIDHLRLFFEQPLLLTFTIMVDFQTGYGLPMSQNTRIPSPRIRR